MSVKEDCFGESALYLGEDKGRIAFIIDDLCFESFDLESLDPFFEVVGSL